MKRLSPLEDLHVVCEVGTRLGRVFELRSHGRAEIESTRDQRAIDALLCGRRGLLECLGMPEPGALAIRGNDGPAIRPHTVVVRGSVDSNPKLEGYRSET